MVCEHMDATFLNATIVDGDLLLSDSIAEVCEHLQREAGTNLTFERPCGKKAPHDTYSC